MLEEGERQHGDFLFREKRAFDEQEPIFARFAVAFGLAHPVGKRNRLRVLTFDGVGELSPRLARQNHVHAVQARFSALDFARVVALIKRNIRDAANHFADFLLPFVSFRFRAPFLDWFQRFFDFFRQRIAFFRLWKRRKGGEKKNFLFRIEI